MILIVVKFKTRPERSDDWLTLVDEFTQKTRQESGNLWFEWSRSVDDPTEFVLVEAFRDGEAGTSHVATEHFQEAMRTLRDALAETPRILNVEVPGTDWARMGELAVTEPRAAQ